MLDNVEKKRTLTVTRSVVYWVNIRVIGFKASRRALTHYLTSGQRSQRLRFYLKFIGRVVTNMVAWVRVIRQPLRFKEAHTFLVAYVCFSVSRQVLVA